MEDDRQIRTHIRTWRAQFMAIESHSTYALFEIRFRIFLAILCVDALCINQQEQLGEPLAAHT